MASHPTHLQQPTGAASTLPLTIIEPSPAWRLIHLHDLWTYRELLYFLVWRDVKIRYKQTVLGAAWAIIQPVASMIVFTVFFGRLAGLEARTGGVPYPVFVYAGLLPWTFFANAVTTAGNSVVGNQNLVTRVYFPRLIIPLAAVVQGLVDSAIAFVILLGIMLYYGLMPGPELLLLPAVMAMNVAAAAAVGLILAGLTVTYRDFRYIVPFAVQLWLYLTPVIYPVTIVPEDWRWLLALNPMAGLVEAFRFCLLGSAVAFDPGPFAVSALATLGLLLVSIVYFRRLERRFADVV
jgi:lipopolysaccharide transport system permease protein